MDELIYLSAGEMAEAVRSRRISPVELMEAHLKRIGALNPRLNAFVAVDEEGARRHARAAEEAVMKGKHLGPLHGVPVTVKSSIDVAGLPCECGTRLRQGYVATEDAPLVARLRAAGAIPLGGTNVPEFLYAYETDNLLYGRTNSPWDLARTPGGSSGGEAAAIAAGCSAAGVGSDGGGSIRVPAHFSGICGLKPTPGRIPSTGHFPPCTGAFSLIGVVGPMARRVADLELLLEVMAGPDCGDALSAPIPFRRWSEPEARRLRVGTFEDDGVNAVTPETRAAVRAAAAALKQGGFEVAPFRPTALEKARELWWALFIQAGWVLFEPMLVGRENDLSPILRESMLLLASEAPLTAQRLMNVLHERDQLRAQLLKQMDEFPVLLCPVCSVPAFRHREREWTVDGRTVAYLDAMSYCQWFNLLGNPAVVVPAGRSPEGLPIGVQIVGRPYEEEAILAVAKVVERERGSFQRPPM